MEPERSVPSTGPYPEPDHSSPFYIPCTKSHVHFP
jgi:hypothetical protein